MLVSFLALGSTSISLTAEFLYVGASWTALLLFFCSLSALSQHIWSCHYLSYGWISEFLRLFLDCFCLLGWLYGQMESVNVAGVLQDEGNADSRDCTRSEEIEYFIILYFSTFFRFSYLCHYTKFIVLLLQMMGGFMGECNWFILGCRWWVGIILLMMCF